MKVTIKTDAIDHHYIVTCSECGQSNKFSYDAWNRMIENVEHHFASACIQTV